MKKIGVILAAASMLLVSACGPMEKAPTERQKVAQNQKNLVNAIGLPTLETSLERKNLKERLERINQENMHGCVYLLNHGSVVAFYPVRGKVSSMKSYLTPGDQVREDQWGNLTIEAPDLDGAYGENSEGIFFFTADTNSYVEWAGEYLFTDQCLKVSAQPQLVRVVTDK